MQAGLLFKLGLRDFFAHLWQVLYGIPALRPVQGRQRERDPLRLQQGPPAEASLPPPVEAEDERHT